MSDINSDELSRQLSMIEGLNLEPEASTIIAPKVEPRPIETVDTLLGNIPFGSVTTQDNLNVKGVNTNGLNDINVNSQENLYQPVVGKPFTPENPINQGVITSNTIAPQSVTPQVQSQPQVTAGVMQTALENANMQAQAQVVQPTTTTLGSPVNMEMPVQPMTSQVVTPEPSMDMNAAPVFVNLGESTYETKTDFLKLKEGEATRVTLINYNAVATHEHFKEGLGYFRCKSTYEPGQRWPSVRAICCQQPKKDDPSKLENAGFKVLLPVIEYPVNHSDGKTLIAGGAPKLKVIKLSQQEYNQLEEIRNEYGEDTASFDIYLTRKKESTGFLKYYLTAGKSWRAQFAQAIQEETSKLSNETYNIAVSESAKDISIERLQQFFMEQKQQEQMAAQFANQPAIDPGSLGINGLV